ncbi:exocyst complex component 4-like [Sycon ciliatum]|uniref:exocyst complex component 4-like n=1 Tax=Sycon ciliatum TaxID=27933 RepID=UPI0020ACE202|eukprot:scpid37336/ scgid8911/ Exocyst complex component 4; Exocyst complex component Sec8
MTSVRENSQLLMAVIEGLSTGGVARESEKERLMKKYESADRAIDQVVDEHHDALTQSIRSYTKISANLIASQQRVTFLKESLVKCKKLLHCKRGYLLKLWLECREQREILKILDKIEEVKGVPEQVNRHLANKHYLLATKMVTRNVKLLEDDLGSIEALRELRCDMRDLKETLHNTLIDELHRHLYTVAAAKCRRTMESRQQSSSRARSIGHSGSHSFFTTSPVPMDFAVDFPNQKQDLNALSCANTTGLMELDPDTLEDKMTADPEEDSTHFMLILVHSLSILNKIPDTIDRIIVRMDTEFTKLVQSLIEEIAARTEEHGDTVYFTAEADRPGQQKLLLQLLRLAFERFQAVALAHNTLLGQFKAVMLYSGISIPLYNMEEVWSSVQFVLQALLGEYFDVKNSQSNRDATNFHSISNMSQYFDNSGKKKSMQRRNKSLFAFDSSTIALTVQSVQASANGEDITALGREYMPDAPEDKPPFKFLCKPHPENVTVVFNELLLITSVLKDLLSIPTEQHCPLSEFVEDFVNVTYLNRIRSDTRDKVIVATEGGDAFKVILTDDGGAKKAGPSKPVFQGAVSVVQLFARFRSLLAQLPSFRPQILDVVIGVVDMFRKSTLDSFRRLAKPCGVDALVLSASWTSDTLVLAAFFSFHSWTEQPVGPKQAGAAPEATQASKTFAASPHTQETEYLKKFLRDTSDTEECKLRAGNIMSLSESTFGMLACTQESLEWTYNCYVKEETRPNDTDPEEVSRHEFIQDLKRQLVEMSQRVLVILHIELRFQCYYYLRHILQRRNYVCKENDSIDSAIMDVNKFLSGVEEALSPHLQPMKMKYLLSGLGHFMASLILDACYHIKELNRHGIKKLCRMIFSIQQNLTNLTMAREVELDRARQYCELFHLHADELCRVILDHGRIFSDEQYKTALRLMILQGQAKKAVSFNEYWSKVQGALAGKRQ